MPKPRWTSTPLWLLVAFFIFGGIGNIFVSAENAANYARWGYPDWFHYITGLLELTTAGLLAFAGKRLWGVGLGSAVMIAAAGTVLAHGEFSHAIPPLVVLAVLVFAGWLELRGRRTSATASAST